MTTGNGSRGSGRGPRSDVAAGAAEGSPGSRGYVLLAVADRRLAVAIESVERVVHAVELVDAELPAPLVGWVNLHGEMVPAIDLRRRLGLPPRDLVLSDRLVLVRRGALRWFLIADGVAGMAPIADSLVRGAGRGAVDCCSAEVSLEDGAAAFLDVARLLGAAEVAQIQRAQAELAERAAIRPGGAEQDEGAGGAGR